MSEVDELDINPFFKALQTKFADIYKKAEEDCNLICIPRAECLQGAYINQKFVNTHILKPSPFFKGQYISLLSDKQTVTIDSTGEHVTTEEGFPTKVKIKVISEELCYNKEYKPYKILIIERPLDLNILRKQQTDDRTQSGELKLKYSQKECREVLQAYPEFSKHVKELDSEVWKFNHNYILLKDYLEEAIEKLETMLTTSAENCVGSIKSKGLISHQFKDYIRGTVETYLMSSVHLKLYPVICERCRDQDADLVRKCRSLRGLTPDQLRIPEHFCCPLPSAVVELAHLDGLITPIEKFYCLKTTFNMNFMTNSEDPYNLTPRGGLSSGSTCLAKDNITEEIDKNIQETQPPGVALEDPPCLTSDDLIPILVTVIVQAKCSHVFTDIYYMENFYWSAGTKDRDNLSYCLVTFTAAVQYMMSTDFSDIDVKSKLEENEVSFQELVKSDIASVIPVAQTSSNSHAGSTGRPRTQSRSRFDRQIDNISKMLEETTTETKPKQKSTAQAFPSLFGGPVSKSPSPLTNGSGRDTEKKTEDMGDFLSGLQDNMFLSFGKQT